MKQRRGRHDHSRHALGSNHQGALIQSFVRSAETMSSAPSSTTRSEKNGEFAAEGSGAVSSRLQFAAAALGTGSASAVAAVALPPGAVPVTCVPCPPQSRPGIMASALATHRAGNAGAAPGLHLLHDTRKVRAASRKPLDIGRGTAPMRDKSDDRALVCGIWVWQGCLIETGSGGSGRS